MNRLPIFCVDFRKGSFRDTVSGIFPAVVGTPEFKQGDKGQAVYLTATTNEGLTYAKVIPKGTYSVVMWTNTVSTNIYTYMFDCRTSAVSGIGYCSNLLGPGATYLAYNGKIYKNNVATNVIGVGSFEHVIISGMTLSTDTISLCVRYGLLGTYKFGSMAYFAIYEGTLSATERDALYQDFLNSTGSITTPNILKPRIEVDPKGTSVCFDFQQYKGGNTVLDLSGNGNHGTGITGNQPVENGVVCDNVNAGFTVTVPNMSVTHATAFTLEMMLRSDSSAVATPFLTFGGGYTSGIRLFTVSNTCQTQIGKAGAPLTVIDNVNSSQHEMHYVLTYSDGSFITYINGVKRTTTALPMIWASNIATPFQGFGGGPQKRLTGKFFSVYPRALTEAEIKTKYNKIARTIDLQVMGDNLLCDQKVYTANQYMEI